MKKINKIIIFSSILSVTVSSAFASEIDPNFKEKELKNELEEKHPIKITLEKNKKIEKKISVVKNPIMVELEKTKNEVQRQKVLSRYKTQINITSKPRFVSEKTKLIFNKFDLILTKIENIEKNIQNNILSLEESNLELDFVKDKNIELKSHIKQARIEELTA